MDKYAEWNLIVSRINDMIDKLSVDDIYEIQLIQSRYARSGVDFRRKVLILAVTNFRNCDPNEIRPLNFLREIYHMLYQLLGLQKDNIDSPVEMMWDNLPRTIVQMYYGHILFTGRTPTQYDYDFFKNVTIPTLNEKDVPVINIPEEKDEDGNIIYY